MAFSFFNLLFFLLDFYFFRFLRRGVNEKGKVANDVETEQVVSESTFEGQTIQISSIMQNRGSIPVFWSQETSLLKIFNPVVICMCCLN